GVLPLVAGVVGGWYVGRDVAPTAGADGRADAEGAGGTLLVSVLTACCCGALMALLAGFAGGALGTGALAHFGPSWWRTGGAALCVVGVLGVPVALVVRGWRLRERRREGRSRDEWHTTASRHTRWAALKKASGGLMNDFDPRH
ncbi:cell division protein PerM, partial [Streptomyces daliensis]